MNAPARPTGPPAKPKRRGMVHAQDRHRRAARMVGFLLVADSPALWKNSPAFWKARLTQLENASLALSLFLGMDPELRQAVAKAACGEGACEDQAERGVSPWGPDFAEVAIAFCEARDRRGGA